MASTGVEGRSELLSLTTLLLKFVFLKKGLRRAYMTQAARVKTLQVGNKAQLL